MPFHRTDTLFISLRLAIFLTESHVLSYASSDLSPARLLQNRRFNTALVALLDLVRQLVEHGRRTDRGWGFGNIEWVQIFSLTLGPIARLLLPLLRRARQFGVTSVLSVDSWL